jgi:L-asparaginase / beta-aspartyl-peptidase
LIATGGAAAPQPPLPAILIHAGAGPFRDRLRADQPQVTRVLHDVLTRGRTALEQGADALAVAIRCVELLEDCELFNAGVGSALCADGTVEMSAAAMRGSDRAAGAVAGVHTVRNPIRAAELVLGGQQVLMIGEPADRRAAEHGLATQPNDAFITKREQVALALRAQSDAAAHGTVGAVCRDRRGELAAATSTGGISGQPPGRVGDSPLFGAGTWADANVAVSCTGEGEAFIRAGAAARIAAQVAAGRSLQTSASDALAEVGAVGGRGGLIALSAAGAYALELSTEAMPRGRWQAGGEPQVWVAR